MDKSPPFADWTFVHNVDERPGECRLNLKKAFLRFATAFRQLSCGGFWDSFEKRSTYRLLSTFDALAGEYGAALYLSTIKLYLFTSAKIVVQYIGKALGGLRGGFMDKSTETIDKVRWWRRLNHSHKYRGKILAASVGHIQTTSAASWLRFSPKCSARFWRGLRNILFKSAAAAAVGRRRGAAWAAACLHTHAPTPTHTYM